MTDNNLIIFLSPKTIDPQLFYPDKGSVRWVYLGKKFHEKSRLERELGPSFQCIDITRIHNDVADTIRQDFIGWIDTINRLNGSSIEWWFGPVSSRNIYRSDLFQYCCYMEILETLWKDPDQRPAFVVVESPALTDVIQKWGSDRNISIRFQGIIKKIVNRLSSLVFFPLRGANFIVTTSLRKCAATMLTHKPSFSGTAGESLVIIHTYIHPTSITESGRFSDRYFPQLYEFLGNHGKKIAVLPTYHGFRYNYFELFSRIRKSGTSFIIPEQYLKLSDFFYAFYHPLRLFCERYQSPIFRTIDYTEIIREDTIHDKFENSLEAILFYRLTRRLKDEGLCPERVIDWYENQPKSRALAAGFRKYFPGVPVIGAQIFLHYPNFLSLSPTDSEIRASMVPHNILATSPYQCKLATRFAHNLECRPCAALRYAHLFGKNRDPVADAKSSDVNTILLLASFDIEETLELLSQILGVIENISSDICILIKFHPDMEKETIIGYFEAGKWPERIKIFSGNISEALNLATLVISKSSGSIVEAATQGIPVIFLGNQTKLNINPLTGINIPGYSECYSDAELLGAIQKYLNLSRMEKDEYRIIGNSMRDLFFLPVNDDTLAPFLENNE